MYYGSILLKRKENISGNIIIEIPSSKSISNRLLIIKYLSNSDLKIENLSTSEDTVMLQDFLQASANKTNNLFNCRNAGTTLRFLLAFLSLKKGQWIIDADRRMLDRPLRPLMEILQQLGADIQVSDKKNIFPITIVGKELSARKTPIYINENLTSQIVSALLLISPRIKGELTLVLPNGQSSMPYIDMTINLVNSFGGNIKKDTKSLICSKSQYKFNAANVEQDYSSAAFIYLYVFVGKLKNIFINRLQTSVLQGDFVCVEMFRQLGVETVFNTNGAMFNINETVFNTKTVYSFDLIATPDLFCPLAVACFLSGKSARLKSLASLRVKESDRLNNMITELNKIDNRCYQDGDDLIIKPQSRDFDMEQLKTKTFVFETYNDHRIAMSLSAIALVCRGVEIKNPSCVAKSFPNFWQQISKLLSVEMTAINQNAF